MAQAQTKQAAARPRTAIEAMIDKLPDAGMITVGCKLPNGIILRLFDMQERTEVTLSGERQIRQAVLKPEVEFVQLKGCASPMNAPIQLFGGYALTHNVDAQFFKEWLRQNADNDIVKNRLVFAQDDASRAQDQATESAEVLSGLQPLVMPGVEGVDASRADPRMPRSNKPGVSSIETSKAA